MFPASPDIPRLLVVLADCHGPGHGHAARVPVPSADYLPPMSDRAQLDRARSDSGSRLLVLGFHNVERTWRYPSPPGEGVRNFGRHLRILDRLANVVPLTDALDALAAGRPLPARAVALTFDDGYRDNLTLAAPILRRFDMPATIYLVPHFLSGLEHAWWERLGWAVRQATVSHVTHNGACHSLHDEDARVAAVRHLEEDLKATRAPSGRSKSSGWWASCDQKAGSHTTTCFWTGKRPARWWPPA